MIVSNKLLCGYQNRLRTCKLFNSCRSEREKQKVRDWMRRKQRERLSQYVSDVQKLKESESRPFQGGGVPKSTQRLKAADNKRRAKQR